MTFRELLTENKEPLPIYNDIMPKITKKYGEVKFTNSMGSLAVYKDKVIIGHINRKNIDNWEKIIDKRLLDIKNKTPDGIADETNVDMSKYR